MSRPGLGAHSRLLILVTVWSAGWLGGSAHGHGLEFLVARLELEPDALRLEVTADWQDHPLLETEAGAQQVIRELFEVAWKPMTDDSSAEDGSGVSSLPWTALAELHFEVRTQWDETAPLPVASGFSERAHRLVCGVWRWQVPPGSLVQLRVPPGQALDTLLWQPAQGTDGEPGGARWTILITGDQSPWMGPFETAAPALSSSLHGVYLIPAMAGLALLGAALGWRLLRCSHHKESRP